MISPPPNLPPPLPMPSLPPPPVQGYSSRSLFSHSHSEASLPGSSSATSGPAVRPTSVVARKSRIALLHLSSAKSSETLNRSLPRPVSSDHRPQSLLLAFPLRAVLEQMLSYLGLVVSPRRNRSVFLFNHIYSHLAKLDYGGTRFYPFPVRRPAPKGGLSGGTLVPPSGIDPYYTTEHRRE